jgi:Calcineurin-like phosphoesterase
LRTITTGVENMGLSPVSNRNSIRPSRAPSFLVPFALLVLVAAASAETVRFAVASDNRGRPGFVEIEKQIKKAAGGTVRFLISPGDEDPPETTREQIDQVFGAQFLWYPVVGNHELKHLPYLRSYYLDRLKRTTRPGPKGCRETTYSFDVGNVHIAVLNAFWNGEQGVGDDRKFNGGIVAPLRAWLADDLRATSKAWKLVVAHPPAFPRPDQDWHESRHVGESLDRHPADRDAFWALLDRQGVAAYICGHSHRYSRYQPPGSRVWQIDAALARGETNSWKYDTFVIVTADERRLKFEVYRNLKARGKFEITDTLTLTASQSAH